MERIEDIIRHIIDHDSEETVALTFKTKARLVRNITSEVERYFDQSPQKESPQSKEGEKEVKMSAEEYYEKECWRFDFGKTEKDGFVSVRQKDLTRFAEEFASQGQPEVTDQMIEDEFPMKSKTTALTMNYIEANMHRREGARWAISQMKKTK